MNFIIFSLCFILFFYQAIQARDYSENELLEIGKSAIDKRASAKGSEEEKAAFRNAFNGLSDAQKIRAISYRVLASDDDPRYSMRSSNSSVAAYALGQDKELISDWSELRKMLIETRDPRKFFLIAGIIPWSNDEHKHDFVYELTHMLFADGRVSKDEGEYTKSYADDVSEYAYSAIVGKLRSLKADFEPPAKDLPHDEQTLVLAKWLKEKWPGCENLEIPGQQAPEGKRPDRTNQGAKILTPPTAITSKERVPVAPETEQAVKKSHWPWLIGGVIFFAMLFLLIRVVKTR
jgi:hypothetical protein